MSLQIFNNQDTTISINNIPVEAGLPTQGDILGYNETTNQWSFLSASAIGGPTGPAGPAGVTGPTGPTGLAGATGAAGVTGPTGLAGATGAAGAAVPIRYTFSSRIDGGGYGEKPFPSPADLYLGTSFLGLVTFMSLPAVLTREGLLDTFNNFAQNCILVFSCTWAGYKTSAGDDFAISGSIPITVRPPGVVTPYYVDTFTYFAVANENIDTLLGYIYAAAWQNTYDPSYTRTYITYTVTVESAPYAI